MKTLLENADFIEISDDEKEKVVGGDDINAQVSHSGSQLSGGGIACNPGSGGIGWGRHC